MERVAAERAVLRAMCQGLVWKEALGLLKDYRFRDTAHQIVFDALRRLGSDDPAAIREHLPRRLALGGFPDLDARDFFQTPGVDTAEAQALIRWLIEESATDEHR